MIRFCRWLPTLAVLPFVCGLSLADDKPVSPAVSPAPSEPQKGTDQKTNTDKNPIQDAPKLPLQTPAQVRFGSPRNPVVGEIVDVDLTKPLSLRRAVRIGLQRQNSIAISRTQVDSANARLTQSQAAYLPRVTPSFSFNTNLQPGGIVFVNGQAFRGSATSQVLSNGINASFTIYDMGLREASVGAARRNTFASEFGLGDQRQGVILTVTSSYYSLARSKELVRVQEENVRRAETNLAVITEQVKVGSAAKSDTLQAQSDLANARVSLLSAQSDYDVAQASLKNAMGIVADTPVNLTDDTVALPEPTADPLKTEDYMKIAYDNRLDLRQQVERIYAQGYSVRQAIINNGLTLSATINQGYALDPNSGPSRTFLVSASYPLFDGGSSRAAVRDSKAQLEQQRRTLDQLQQSIRLNVEQSLRVREVARQRVQAAKVAVEAGQLNYQAALERQRNGLINILDVLNAQVQLVTAQVSLVQATYDFYISDAQLVRFVGVNDPEYTPRVPGYVKPVQPGITPAPSGK